MRKTNSEPFFRHAVLVRHFPFDSGLRWPCSSLFFSSPSLERIQGFHSRPLDSALTRNTLFWFQSFFFLSDSYRRPKEGRGRGDLYHRTHHKADTALLVHAAAAAAASIFCFFVFFSNLAFPDDTTRKSLRTSRAEQCHISLTVSFRVL